MSPDTADNTEGKTKPPTPIAKFFGRMAQGLRARSPSSGRSKTSRDKSKEKDTKIGNQRKDSEPEVKFKAPLPTTKTKPDRLSSYITSKIKGNNVTASNEKLNRLTEQPTFVSTPRPAASESDLRYVTIDRGVGMPTPLAGVSMSMDRVNGDISDDGLLTTTRKTPSYINIARTLHGYRSPRSAVPETPTRPTGKSLIQRRKEQLAINSDPSPQSARSPSPEPTGMGNSCSSPTIRSLIGRFDSLHLCTEKDDSEKENMKPPIVVTTQPQALNKVHPMKEEVKLDSDIAAEKLEQELEKKLAVEPTENEETLVTANAQAKSLDSASESHIPSEPQTSPEPQEVSKARSGDTFRNELNSTRLALEARCTQATEELNTVTMPEEAADDIRMATGKARLLIKKKLSKFEELVTKNLNPVSDDPQPVTEDDLEGYWELIAVELAEIYGLFSKVDAWRTNNWQIIEGADEIAKEEKNNNEKPLVPVKPRRPQPAKSQVDPEKQKAAAEKRRQQLAAAKARAKQQMECAQDDNILTIN